MSNTLVDLLRHQAATRGDSPAYTYVVDGDREELTWTWADLDLRARAVAVAVRRVAQPGDRVLVLYPQGLDYLAALYGCMYAGVLAVPLQPPGRHRAKSALPKLEAIAADGGVALAVTVTDLLADMRDLVAASAVLADVPFLATDAVDLDGAGAWVAPALQASDLAYLQYTSGSTSAPKGVMVTHANLLYNLRDFATGYAHDHDSVMVSWLPTFHDLGLVYGVFMPLFIGFRAVLLDPLHFLQRPMRWLEAFSRHHGTHGPCPNFAFDLCVARSTPEERAALDLRPWRVALNGAEPIRYESEARFVEAFSAAGVTWATLSHAYGMSEATACISKEWVGSPRVFLDVDGAALERHQVAPVAAGAAGARRIAGCGRTSNETVVRAVEPDTLVALGDDAVGELWVGGPTVAAGYWHQPEATREGFEARTTAGEGPFLRTGDLGFVRDGQVFVTGRLKDLIIIRGENHYPQDIEWSVEAAHPAIRPSCVAAFSLSSGGVEALGVVAEVYPERLTDPETAFAAVREAVGEHGLSAQHIVLVAPRALFKTSSGKVMRRKTRESMLDGTLAVVARWDRPEAAPEPVVVSDDLRARLDAAPAQARGDLLAAHVLARVAALLGLPADALDADMPLKEMGFDSVQAVELADQLSHDLGRDVAVTSLYEHPTADALAAWLLRGASAPVVAVAPPFARPELSTADLEDASDDELAALLRAELLDL